MAKLPLTIKISKLSHAFLKAGAVSMAAKVDNLLTDATIDDVVTAIKARYGSDDVPDDVSVITKVLVSASALQNADLITLKTGLSRDLLISLLLENLVKNRVNPLHTTKQNP